MSRLIDFDRERGVVVVAFPFDEVVVDIVRSLPERQFDQASRRWWIPAHHAAKVVDALEPHSFHHTPRFRIWWDTRLEPKAPDSEDGLTVSALNRDAGAALRQAFPLDLWVVGELQGFERNTKRNVWFEIVERRGQEMIARVNAFMFEGDADRIAQRIAQTTPDVPWRDGLAVRVRVRVEFYEAGGRFQIHVKDVDPAYSTGVLAAHRDQILRRLEAEGISNLNASRELPICPLRIGLITSSESEAYNDFVDEIHKSGFAFEVSMFPATMQGQATEASVLRALRWFYRRAHDFDVLVMTRGGGSRTDLAWLDSYALARAVCMTPIKIITGVGHHRDQCVLDFVSMPVKTPTAAAQALIARVLSYENHVLRLAKATSKAAALATQKPERRLDTDVHRLVAIAQSHLIDQSGRLTARDARLRRAARDIAAEASSRVERAGAMVWQAGRAEIKTCDQRIDAVETQIRLLDPRRVLARGYAMVRRSGRVTSGVAAFEVGDEFTVELADGRLDGRVTAKQVEEGSK